MATSEFLCANWEPGSVECKKKGKYSCKNCLLVLYCGSGCQKLHWTRHKSDCRAPLGKDTWNPAWVLENRTPAFISAGPSVVWFGGKKYLWGNVPALDVLRLGSNEGDDYDGQLRLLFAASGDLRNVVQTIAQLPRSYCQPIEVTMNDHDLDIVARNVIMLLIAFSVNNIDEAIDCIIHVWYSALIRKSDLDVLQQRIRPLIEDVCTKIKDKAPTTLLAKTWEFGRRSLRLVLEKAAWGKLLSFMSTPEGLTAERAQRIRRAVTLAESRKDYRDRHMLFQPRAHRIAKHRFREDGLLLPFGSRRNDFQEPNPTLFKSTDTPSRQPEEGAVWPMFDNADPLNGWPSAEVEARSSGPATADIYGKLFYHVQAMLRSFCLRLSDLNLTFKLLQMDAKQLPDHLESGSYTRIEVSNISDGGYLGVHQTVCSMVPLLQGPLVNPHATLITLFMNAVDENTTAQDKMAQASNGPLSARLLKYLPPSGPPSGPNDPEVIKFAFARDMVATFDHVFDRFMKKFKFSELGQIIGAEVKDKHTIVEKWPFRLKLRPGQPGAQEEFDRVLAGGVSGNERYVEWRRTAVYEDEMGDE